mmetsp:Transcript_14464/g.51413  ORF Transcript_14464/g.51413 Transcript_14464/m.51413 type:complete len:121 (+) Transcript_14464:75-437(+)
MSSEPVTALSAEDILALYRRHCFRCAACHDQLEMSQYSLSWVQVCCMHYFCYPCFAAWTNGSNWSNVCSSCGAAKAKSIDEQMARLLANVESGNLDANFLYYQKTRVGGIYIPGDLPRAI